MRIATLLLSLFAVIGAASAGSPADEAPSRTYTFGVVPQWDRAQLESAWNPLLSHVSEATGYTLELRTEPSIDLFHAQAGEAAYDFIYINPHNYVGVSEHYEAIARQRNKLLKGILVARSDAGIESPEDLAGKAVALPLGAFAATLINKLVLSKAGLDLATGVEIRYVSSHTEGYEMVVKGEVAAAGGVGRTFNGFPDDQRSQLSIMHTSEGYSPHPIAALKTLPEEVVHAVQAALVALAESESDGMLLDAVKLSKGLEAVDDADYEKMHQFAEMCALLGITAGK